VLKLLLREGRGRARDRRGVKLFEDIWRAFACVIICLDFLSFPEVCSTLASLGRTWGLAALNCQSQRDASGSV
jgi:hypothetical protein